MHPNKIKTYFCANGRRKQNTNKQGNKTNSL